MFTSNLLLGRSVSVQLGMLLWLTLLILSLQFREQQEDPDPEPPLYDLTKPKVVSTTKTTVPGNGTGLNFSSFGFDLTVGV